MNNVSFLEPVFKGGRFTNSSLPMQILSDLIAYEELIRAIAKELYFSANKGKTRLPKGFQDRFQLSIADIRSGSVIPVLSREFEHELQTSDEFDQARDLLNHFIATVNENKTPVQFPSKVLSLFEKLGASLQQDEMIELRVPGTEICPVYSRLTRSKILSISKKPYLNTCYLTGAVSGFDAEKRKLYLVLENGQLLEGPLDASFDILLRTIAAHYKKKDIAVTVIGLAKYQPDGSVAEIKKLQHVIVYQEGVPEFFPNLKERFVALSNLKPGWYHGEGAGFQSSDLLLVQRWLDDLLHQGDLPSPFIYPSQEQKNAVECEWSFGCWEVSFSFLIDPKVLVMHAAHIDSEEIREDRFYFHDSESIIKARRFLINLLPYEFI